MHPAQRALYPAFHRSFGLAQKHRRLSVCVSAEVGELDSPALVGRKFVHGFAKRVRESEAHYFVLEVVLSRCAGPRFMLFASFPPAGSAQPVDSPAVREVEEERSKGPPFGVVALRAVPKLDERVVS